MARSRNASVAGDARLADRYRVLRHLGRGGMATVLLCEDEVLERPVAVKRLIRADETSDLRRFRREAKVGAALRHPNLVTVFDTIEDDDGALIVMEFVDGGTLADQIRGRRLEPERALEILSQVAAALDHAHEHGVVHRDVKPANVLIGSDGTVKLADLGIASTSDLTQTTGGDVILGTLAYMAPERLKGEEATPAADVYSMAMIAYEVLSGQRGRQARTPAEAVAEAVNEPPPDLAEADPDAPPAAGRAIARGLHPNPDRRPASAGELIARLAEAYARPTPEGTAPLAAVADEPSTEELPATTPPPVPPPARPAPAVPARRRPSLLPWLVAGVVLALIVGVAIAGVGDSSNGGGSQPLGAQEGEEGTAAPTGEGDRDPGTSETGESTEPAAEDGSSGPATGAELNEQGFALIEEGRYEEAVPILEDAVAAFGEDTSDINYAYALYNLGYALLYSGRAEEAIPILEQRLEIPNQRGEVRKTLEEAYAAAGYTDGGGDEDD